MAGMNSSIRTRAELLGSCQLPTARRNINYLSAHFRLSPIICLSLAVLILALSGCTAISPVGVLMANEGATKITEAETEDNRAVLLHEPPHVVLNVGARQSLQPGDAVEIWVSATGDQPISAYRLAIDGLDTGWHESESLPGNRLFYSWVAGEPGAYEIVGEARDDGGHVGESRYALTVVLPQPTRDAKQVQPAESPTAETPSATAAPLQSTIVPDKQTGKVSIHETTVVLSTYPYEEYQSDAVDPLYRWPYKKFDRERYLDEAPAPEDRTYRLLVLENAYLRILILPELGGRVWQVVHKPSGDTMFYQNSVVKPTPWGPANQLGWLALGGIEWSLPVIEHGYDWGTPWESETLEQRDGSVTVTVSTPDDGRLLRANIGITLYPDDASFQIEPSLTNLSDEPIKFDYWQTAMLAPGAGNEPSSLLQFRLPGDYMTVHSTADAELPAPGERLSWPVYQERDLSTLGNWRQYLGFFEYPAAHGPFTGVYDIAYDAGAVRVFPAQIARGSKVFAPGWRDALSSSDFTDDASTYIELHGGLAPTFFEQYQLPAAETVSWRERWYPVSGLKGLSFANEQLAAAAQRVPGGLRVGLYPTQPFHGELVLLLDGEPIGRRLVEARPDMAFETTFEYDELGGGTLSLQVEDGSGVEILLFDVSEN